MKKFASLVIVTSFLAACGSSQDGPLYDFCQGSTEVTMDYDKLLLPFPSDYFLIEDSTTPSGYRINLTDQIMPASENMFEAFPFMQEQLAALDGFGTSASIVFGFSKEIGTREEVDEEFIVTPPPSLAISPADTVKTDSPVVLLNISSESADYGNPVPVILEYLSDEDARGRGQYYLIVEPAFALRPKTTFALALTTRLKNKQDHCLAPSAATQQLLSGENIEEFGLLGQRTSKALEILTEKGFIQDAGDLSALTVFTTQSIDEEILSATKEILDSSAANPLSILPGSLEMSPGSGGVALVVTGKFIAANYQSEDGTFVIENNLPVAQGTEELEFELVIPEETAQNKPPFPLVIYQHGLLGYKTQDMGAKRAQARAGFASIAIDAVLHGSRKAESGWEVTNFFAIDLSTGQFNMPKLRDNFRQCYLDLVSLAELTPAVAELDLLPEGNPDGQTEILAAPVYLSGHSLGAIIAGGAIGLSPRIPIANLCAGGGSLPTNLFMRSEIFGTFIDMLRPEDTTEADVKRFMPLLQILVERGDPVNLARLAITEPNAAAGSVPKHILFQEVMNDTFVPNQANDAMGRGLGLSHVQPVIREVFGLAALDEPCSLNNPQNVTAAFFQFDILADGTTAEHTEIYADPVAQTQWIHFFETFRDTGIPEVIDPYRVMGIERP
ncbi:MAG: hypothetical protein JRJ87_13935 [Deltaproteobacteria bacterium]|nr:hypothetical protein [Deltaproteobacteria bacterium]